jgi:hypothetical protein
MSSIWPSPRRHAANMTGTMLDRLAEAKVVSVDWDEEKSCFLMYAVCEHVFDIALSSDDLRQIAAELTYLADNGEQMKLSS